MWKVIPTLLGVLALGSIAGLAIELALREPIVLLSWTIVCFGAGYWTHRWRCKEHPQAPSGDWLWSKSVDSIESRSSLIVPKQREWLLVTRIWASCFESAAATRLVFSRPQVQTQLAATVTCARNRAALSASPQSAIDQIADGWTVDQEGRRCPNSGHSSLCLGDGFGDAVPLPFTD